MSAPLRLFAERDGVGPPLLLIHGLGADHRDWRDVKPSLARRYRVIAPDLRGHGASPRGGGPYSPGHMARDVLALMDAEGIDRAPVVGHSMGGAVALSMALIAPHRLRALAIVNCLPSFRPQRFNDWREITMRLLLMGLLGPRRLGALMAQRSFPLPAQSAERALVMARAAHNSRRVYLASLLRLACWSVRERLSEIRMPALVVASELDYLPIAQVRACAAALSHARFEVAAGARHGLPLEQGKLLAAWLSEFLGELPD